VSIAGVDELDLLCRNASEPYGCTAKIKSVSHNRDLHAGGTIKEKLLRLQEKQKHDAEKNGVVDDGNLR
jgi:hypothetical protein